MTLLWPRLPSGDAYAVFTGLEQSGIIPEASTAHGSQVFAQVGNRAGAADLQSLRDGVVDLARGHGMDGASSSKRTDFDAEAARLLHEHMSMTWAEAGSREVWSFVSCVLPPDVTEWRWQGQKTRNPERWVATDLTRHTWSRLWWLLEAFQLNPQCAFKFQESELNQLLERRSIGGNQALLAALSRSLLAELDKGAPRRPLVRDVTLRLRRYLAFLDLASTTSDELKDITDAIVAQSVRELKPKNAFGDADI